MTKINCAPAKRGGVGVTVARVVSMGKRRATGATKHLQKRIKSNDIPKTCIIFASAEMARLFDFTGPRQPLVPLEDHVWHAPEISAFDDQQGMGHSSVGPPQHRVASHTGPEKQADVFATVIADNLTTATKSGALERLIVIAAPKLLGLLCDYLADPVKDKIWTEIDKDLTHLSLEKVDATVKAHLVA